MAKSNQYVIMNNVDKTFYRTRMRLEDSHWGRINDALSFEECELSDQKKMIVRNSQHYEVILKVLDNGKFYKVY
jgi:hypothetical protein